MPTTENVGADEVARALANFTRENALDGIDVAYQDEAAVNNGHAQGWLERFHSKLLHELQDYAPDLRNTSGLGNVHEIREADVTVRSNASQKNATTATQTPTKETKLTWNSTASVGNGTQDGSYASHILLTYTLPASYFAPGTPGSLFHEFLIAREAVVDRLLVQFYDPAGSYNYTTSEELFGYADSGAVWKSRKQIAEVLGWNEDRIVVQKSLDVEQPGYVAPERLGKAFCDAGQPVSALSVWRIDVRNTSIANNYLNQVRGYQC